jgi:hypothetical protein
MGSDGVDTRPMTTPPALQPVLSEQLARRVATVAKAVLPPFAGFARQRWGRSPT